MVGILRNPSRDHVNGLLVKSGCRLERSSVVNRPRAIDHVTCEIFITCVKSRAKYHPHWNGI